MTEQLSDQLVLAGAVLEKQSASSVPELMNRHPQPRLPVNHLGDLAAEQNVTFGATMLTGEQPVFVPSSQQD